MILDSTNVHKRIDLSHDTLKPCLWNEWSNIEIKQIIIDTVAVFFNEPRTVVYITKFSIQRTNF